MSTRTRNTFFKMPGVHDGAISFEDEVYQMRGGVIECPLEIGEGAHWAMATPDEVTAYKKALAAEDKKKPKDAKDE